MEIYLEEKIERNLSYRLQHCYWEHKTAKGSQRTSINEAKCPHQSSFKFEEKY